MPRTQSKKENLYDPDVALQTELDQVKDDNAAPAQFDPVTMNNWELWKRINNISSRANDSNFTFFTPGSNRDYIEIPTLEYESVATFIFRGTVIWTPNQIKIVAGRGGTGGTSYIRVYDVDNAEVIYEHAYTTEARTLYDLSPLGTLPLNASTFEVQLKRSAANAGKTRISALGMYAI